MSDPIDWTAVRSEPLGTRPTPVIDMATAYPNPVGMPNPQAPRRRIGLVAGVVGAVVLLLAGLGIVGYVAFSGDKHLPIPGAPSTFVVSGTLVVTGCYNPGYDDIHAGTQVVITDEHATTLALGALEESGFCKWIFVIDKVPAGKNFYGISIGRRGTIQYTEQQLQQSVQLSLGA